MKREVTMVSASKVRARFSWCLSHVSHTCGRLEIWRNGKPVAAMVTHHDLERLLEWERKSTRQKELEMMASLEAYRRAEGYTGPH